MTGVRAGGYRNPYCRTQRPKGIGISFAFGSTTLNEPADGWSGELKVGGCSSPIKLVAGTKTILSKRWNYSGTHYSRMISFPPGENTRNAFAMARSAFRNVYATECSMVDGNLLSDQVEVVVESPRR